MHLDNELGFFMDEKTAFYGYVGERGQQDIICGARFSYENETSRFEDNGAGEGISHGAPWKVDKGEG